MKSVLQKITLFFTGLLLLISLSSHAVYINCNVLFNKKTKQLVFALGDLHIDNIGVQNTIKNRVDLISIMKGLKEQGESVHCLVEDVSTQGAANWNSETKALIMIGCNVGDDVLKAQIAKMADEIMGGFIESQKSCEPINNTLGIIQECSPMVLLDIHSTLHGISCTNIEQRKMWYDFRKHNKMDSVFNIAVLDEKERKGFDALYRIAINKTMSNIKNNYIREQLLDFMHTCPVSDSELGDTLSTPGFMVEIAAIDDIYENAHVRNVFLCAGAVHNKKINEFLLSTGDYEHVASFGEDYDSSYRDVNVALKAGKAFLVHSLDLKQTFNQMSSVLKELDTRQTPIKSTL
ncbi:MAG TPA: hypothetical protein VGT41_04170 [Candidatus Babeliales bacterium]|nr:hypothetical protein [Candidatus Babeliales bacterium]